MPRNKGRRHEISRAPGIRHTTLTAIIQHNRSAIRIKFARPAGRGKRRTEQEFPSDPVEHVKKPVPITHHDHLTGLPLPVHFSQNRHVIGIPVVQIMGRKLIVPAQLTGIRIQRNQRIRIEIVTGSSVTVIIRIRIAHTPVNEVQFWVKAAVHPGSAPSGCQHFRVIRPGFTARLAGSGDRVETPELLPTDRIVSIDKPAGPVFAA